MNSEQKFICAKYNSARVSASPSSMTGLAIETLSQQPIYGVRVKPQGNESGWYIWGGDLGSCDDFFEPVHHEHVKDICPFLEKYLALDYGFKFIVDKNGFEDVWKEDV